MYRFMHANFNAQLGEYTSLFASHLQFDCIAPDAAAVDVRQAVLLGSLPKSSALHLACSIHEMQHGLWHVRADAGLQPGYYERGLCTSYS